MSGDRAYNYAMNDRRVLTEASLKEGHVGFDLDQTVFGF